MLQELATGRSNAATAKALFMSERAVEKHVGSVFQKLGLVARVRRQPPGDGGAGLPRGDRWRCDEMSGPAVNPSPQGG